MSKLKIYGERLSRTERVLWAADECGLEYDHIPVPVNGDKDAALLAINPDGAIPTIDDDGFVLSQSWAITLYLGRKYGGDFASNTSEEEADILRWTFWAATDVEVTIIQMIEATGMLPSYDADPLKMADCTEKLQRPIASLERFLDSKTYITGERFTMGDLNAVSIISWLALIGFDFTKFSNVKSWIDRCAARPKLGDGYDNCTSEI